MNRATDSTVVESDRVLEGYSNEVHRVRCADGQRVVVRILRFDDDVSAEATAAEAAAIEMARAVGVPAPRILLLDTVRIDDVEFPVMVQEAVPGQQLDGFIDRLSERQAYAVLSEIGGLIRRLSQVTVDDRRDWPSEIATELDHLRAMRDTILSGGLAPSELDLIMDLLERYAVDFPCQRWVLCHGDLSLKHIFVGTNGTTARVTGIIDFGDWKYGVPVHDLAVLRAREPRLDPGPILAGYGTPADQSFRRRLDLHTLIIAFGSLAFGVEEDDQGCIARSLDQVRSLVRDLLNG